MKREILFKGKRVDNSQWIEGDLIQLDGRKMIAGLDMPAYDNGDVYCNVELRCVQVHPDTVCQFTGLLDKNGNKIFEGDISNTTFYNHSMPDSNLTQEVVFTEGGFALKTLNYSEDLTIEDNRNFVPLYYSHAPNKIKITGNIHDETH